jgi:small-conductance mechanosensitive channel
MDWSDLLDRTQDIFSTSLLSLGEAALTVGEATGFVVVVVLARILAGWLRRLSTRVFTPESEEEEGAAAIVEPVVFWSVLLAGVLVGGSVLGIDWNFVRAVLNAELVTISGQTITPSTVVVFLVIVVLSWGLSRLARRAAERQLRVQQVDEGTVAITQRLLHYAIMAVGLALGLENLGVDLAALFAAGAVFAVGIGFAMQNIAQNFVSGLILLVERSIKPGDVVEVEGRVLSVQKMGIRATVARTRDDEEVIIPNSTLVQNAVKNFTLRDSLYRVRAAVGVAYESDLRQVDQVLAQAAQGLDWRVSAKPPVVLLREFGSSSVNFEVSVWINDPWGAPGAQSRLNDAIWWALKDAGVTIAFPQVDVHFDPSIQEAVAHLPRAS